jgi:hypothetical protein
VENRFKTRQSISGALAETPFASKKIALGIRTRFPCPGCFALFRRGGEGRGGRARLRAFAIMFAMACAPEEAPGGVVVFWSSFKKILHINNN